MAEINIRNSAGRDAVVMTETVRSPLKVRWVDKQGRQAASVRVIKSSIDQGVHALQEQHGELEDVAQALIAGDPEVDLELTGRYLTETSRIFINADREIVHNVRRFEIVRNPDGSVRERRPRRVLPPNTHGDVPLNWSGVFIEKDEAARRFVFSHKVQLRHINGLTYDFLFGMARELAERNSLMLLGAGPKANQPLVLRRGGSPYRGFLEGRTEGEAYCLILHFSAMELKAPATDQPADGE